MTDPTDIVETMRRLADERPLFHSEADFQFALAWTIQQASAGLRVRLEVPRYIAKENQGPRGRTYLDLLVVDATTGLRTAIELKYIKAHVQWQHDGELYDLINSDTDDSARYDFIKDVSRLESAVDEDVADEAVAILLTGNPRLWQPGSSRRPTKDENFRVHEANPLRGMLGWDPTTAASTRAERPNFELRGSYECRWNDYSIVDKTTWRYLAISVPAVGRER